MDRMSTQPYRVAVLAGGESAEREVSLASGARVTAALRAAGHRPETIDPARTAPADVDWSRFDGCFLALHGGAGEDGRIQRWLARRGIPFTGSGSAASRAAMSKSTAKERFRRVGVPTPDWVLLDASEPTRDVVRRVARLGFPVVIKPDAEGSSLGVGIARCEAELAERVAESGRFGRLVIVERKISGREFTVSLLGRKALPPLEIIAHEEIFDYDSKYVGTLTEYHFNTARSPIKAQELQRIAAAAAAALGTSGLARVDMMVDGNDRPWILEVNTAPGMTDHSLAPKAAAQAGLDITALCDWMLREGLGID
jgi:D-alanine-D-alanine ligase